MKSVDRNPIGLPLDDKTDDEGEVTEEDYKEAEEMNEELNEDSATQTPDR